MINEDSDTTIYDRIRQEAKEKQKPKADIDEIFGREAKELDERFGRAVRDDFKQQKQEKP